MNNHVPVLTGAQLRAARALVDCSRDRLADISGVNARTVAAFEKDENIPFQRTEAQLRKALENLGVIFSPETETEHSGVSLRKTK